MSVSVNPLFLKAFAVVGVIMAWGTQALADGTITPEEAAGLVLQVAAALGVEKIIKIEAKVE